MFSTFYFQHMGLVATETITTVNGTLSNLNKYIYKCVQTGNKVCPI